MQPDFDRFFQNYVDAYNRSLTGPVDADGIRAHFTDCFIAAGPEGITCGKNDESFTQTLQKGYEFYRSIGTKQMVVRNLAVTLIDDLHHMVKVFYRADYEKKNGEPVRIDFDVTYFLETLNGKTKVFGFVAGDEMALYKQHGLVAG